MPNLKPFTVSAAQSGAKVVTRDGREVQFLGVMKFSAKYPVAAATADYGFQTFTTDGRFSVHEECDRDLFILAEPKWRAWNGNDEIPVGAALRHSVKSRWRGCIVAVSNSDLLIPVGDSLVWQPFNLVFATYEHSTDGGKTWKICGVEVEA